MKKLLTTLCLVVCAYGAFAQGQINLISNGAARPVYGPDPNSPLSESVLNLGARQKAGSNCTFEVWYAPGTDRLESELKPLVSGDFSKNGVFLKSGVVEIPGVWGGDPVTFQVRAWVKDPRITTWSDFENLNNWSVPRGKSDLFTKSAGGRDRDGIVVLPLSLVGAFPSFGLYILIPEPSSLALGALGLVGLALRRRK